MARARHIQTYRLTGAAIRHPPSGYQIYCIPIPLTVKRLGVFSEMARHEELREMQ
jgi:hypothetical protein